MISRFPLNLFSHSDDVRKAIKVNINFHLILHTLSIEHDAICSFSAPFRLILVLFDIFIENVLHNFSLFPAFHRTVNKLTWWKNFSYSFIMSEMESPKAQRIQFKFQVPLSTRTQISSGGGCLKGSHFSVTFWNDFLSMCEWRNSNRKIIVENFSIFFLKFVNFYYKFPMVWTCSQFQNLICDDLKCFVANDRATNVDTLWHWYDGIQFKKLFALKLYFFLQSDRRLCFNMIDSNSLNLNQQLESKVDF